MQLSLLRCLKVRFIFCFIIFLLTAESFAQSPVALLQDRLRNRIEAGGAPSKIFVAGELVHAALTLPLFYERRMYKLAWVDPSGTRPHVNSLLNVIRQVGQEGLRPSDYHLESIEGIIASLQLHKNAVEIHPGRLIDLELLLTDAFLIMGSHMLSGRVDPKTIDSQWHVRRNDGDLVLTLEQALASNRIQEALESLLPAHSGYERLRSGLKHYRRLAAEGDWPLVPGGPKLQKGDRNDRVAILRQRLFAEGFPADQAVSDKARFDEGLEDALRKFQIQNGLEPDGVLGTQSQGVLNISPEARVRQIVANMERWRWLNQDLGSRYVLVNIAGFYLDVIDNGRNRLHMRVVTGKTYRRTPVFSDKIRYMVMNPYWHVPPSIALKDLVPKIKKDPAFLSKQKFKVFEGWGADTKEIDPDRFDWQNTAGSIRTLRFRQDPGPLNALGRIKFMFPNPHNVYLHDTPSKELFAKSRRDFSSGCIRIEKPVELAEYLLSNDPNWPAEKIRAAITGSELTEQTVKLPEPINVHILYWTVWEEENGQLHFADDIYNRDTAINAALHAPPPRQ